MIGFVFLLSCLTVFRLALMISSEKGPANIFRKLRNLPPPKSSARDGLSCEWCMSIWVSAFVTLAMWKLGFVSSPMAPLWWLSSSAGAIIIHQQWTR